MREVDDPEGWGPLLPHWHRGRRWPVWQYKDWQPLHWRGRGRRPRRAGLRVRKPQRLLLRWPRRGRTAWGWLLCATPSLRWGCTSPPWRPRAQRWPPFSPDRMLPATVSSGGGVAACTTIPSFISAKRFYKKICCMHAGSIECVGSKKIGFARVMDSARILVSLPLDGGPRLHLF